MTRVFFLSFFCCCCCFQWENCHRCDRQMSVWTSIPTNYIKSFAIDSFFVLHDLVLTRQNRICINTLFIKQECKIIRDVVKFHDIACWFASKTLTVQKIFRWKCAVSQIHSLSYHCCAYEKKTPAKAWKTTLFALCWMNGSNVENAITFMFHSHREFFSLHIDSIQLIIEISIERILSLVTNEIRTLTID